MNVRRFRGDFRANLFRQRLAVENRSSHGSLSTRVMFLGPFGGRDGVGHGRLANHPF